MTFKALRILIGIITAFIALTAIGGGLALLFGLEGNRFPLEWLQGTPFPDYTIPALLLAIAVGGSSLIATIMIFAKVKAYPSAAVIAGCILIGYISVEAIILKQVPPGPTVTEIIYFVLGLVVALGAVYIRVAGNRLNTSVV